MIEWDSSQRTANPCAEHVVGRQRPNSKTAVEEQVAGTSPERPAPTTFRRSVSSGRCERDSEDQASAVVGGRRFLASVRNTRQFETFTDGVGGGWVHPSVVRDRSFSVTEEKHPLFVRSDTRGIMRPWLTLANRARRFILRLSGARSGCKVSPALPIFPAATRPHDRRQLSCDLMARYADGETLSVFQFG
jgi:hypothetical protein